MHLPDGLLPAIEWVPLGCVAGGVLLLAGGRLQRGTDSEGAGVGPGAAGFLAAAVLALQAVNFPIGPGVSGHVTGTAMLVAAAGLETALVAMASVLLVQSLFFHDGGVLALGANFVNMAVLPAEVTALLLRFSPQKQPRTQALLAGVGAWLGCVLGALSCAWQLAAAGVVSLRGGLAWMGALHAGIGFLEGVLTASIVLALLRTRQTLSEEKRGAQRGPMVPVLVLAVMAAMLVPFASQQPDALEHLLTSSARTAVAR